MLMRIPAAALLLAASLASGLSGCQPVTTSLSGADPADPKAKVAGVGTRSTIAPYTKMRPVTPTDWRNQNAPNVGGAR